MADKSQTPNVGTRIRFLREQQGLSLRALAGKSGLSVNAIGMIERGENSPTVSSLHNLANALEVRIVDFFEEPHEYSTVFVKKHQRLATRGDDVTMESLGYGIRNQQLEPFLVTLQPGGAGNAAAGIDRRDPGSVSGDTERDEGHHGETVEHPGQEFVYCVTGEVVYQVGESDYVLEEGDSILFDATQPHRFRNDGTTPTQLIIVFQASDGTHIARERHLNA
ncbi:MAG: helix-turn-helix domain-containing protein [Alkalispirochaeta sp.]